jgi:hypothetical protein
VRSLAFDPTGTRLAFVEMRGWPPKAHMVIWDLVTTVDGGDAAQSHITDPSWSPDGSLLAFGSENWDDDNFAVVVWDVVGRTVAHRIPDFSRPEFSPDGSRLFVADGALGRLRAFGPPPTSPPPGAAGPEVRVMGHVSAEGTPMPSLRVHVHAPGARCQWSARTDGAGDFDRTCFEYAPGAPIHVAVVPPAGFRPWEGVATPDAELEIRLESSAGDPTPTPDGLAHVSVRGRVVDAVSSEPLVHAVVEAHNSPRPCAAPVFTDNTGRFEILCSDLGYFSTLTIEVRQPGYEVLAIDVPGSRAHEELTLRLHSEPRLPPRLYMPLARKDP